ncbi:3-methyl-2-oxobutanoate hydroxymethyltransferase [Chamaesiphon sp. OTE_75_metabat_556]|uniref:3-methyl-2-oxobutanoate hydroxymethyltransferase n=1 Tax=Chamaesiphon sp. OTE_75_metabat_556 TaxID=2964692 RepID=UPI00286B2B14|nr:3-methyl-2-oxobutanoate hydroxymethyltransferase [Chamaesiphon sp. OTE_75_metabat_556]
MPTVRQLLQFKPNGKQIVALTAWDFALAQILDEAGVDLILVGDSLAMVTLGYENTLPLTLDEIIHHAKAVKRGVKNALIVVDLPFLSYQISPEVAITSAGRILKETGAQAVKLEGGHPAMVATIARLVEIGIPVMGHIGLTPQSVHQLGYRQQGRDETDRERLIASAVALEAAGAFSIVLEHIPADLAQVISQKLSIPTIGIGAGIDCDGQILVTADLLGLTSRQPPFAKAYVNLREIVTQAVQDYSAEIKSIDR